MFVDDRVEYSLPIRVLEEAVKIFDKRFGVLDSSISDKRIVSLLSSSIAYYWTKLSHEKCLFERSLEVPWSTYSKEGLCSSGVPRPPQAPGIVQEL